MKFDDDLDVVESVFADVNDFSFINDRMLEGQPDVNLEHVSIIISYYDNLERLKLTLEGLRYQTFPCKNMEVLICDDGSPNRIDSILIDYGNTFWDIRYYWLPKNGFGLSKIRNFGMLHSTHQRIILLDCDIVALPNMVYEHIRVLQACVGVVSIGFRHHRMVKENTSLDDLYREISQQNLTFDDMDWRLKGQEQAALDSKLKYDNYFTWVYASGGNLAFNRLVIHEGLMFDESFTEWGGEDNEWAYRLFKKGFYFYPNYRAIAIHQDNEYVANCISEKGMKLLMSKCPRIRDAYKDSSYGVNDIPIVSFWMCNNNRGKYIEEAIRSILSCPYRFEIVIVDDGSTDDSVDIIKAMGVPQVRLIQKNKETLGACYKLALDSCRGEIYVQLDSDDFISSMEFLTQLMIKALFGTEGLVYGHHFMVKENGDFLSDGWVHPSCDRNKSLFEGMHIHPPRIIQARSYARARPIDATLDTAVDYDLYSKILEVSNGTFYHMDCYAYRQHPGSVSANLEESQKLNVAKIIEKRLIYYKVFDKYGFDSTVPRRCIVTRNGHDKLLIKNFMSKEIL
jgi:chondroitin synthase